MTEVKGGVEKYLPRRKKRLSTKVKSLKNMLITEELKALGVYGTAIAVGVLIELIGVRFLEPYMITSNVPANIGFFISLFVFTFGPAIGAGSIIYLFTKDLLKSLTIASVAVPLSVLFFFRIRI